MSQISNVVQKLEKIHLYAFCNILEHEVKFKDAAGDYNHIFTHFDSLIEVTGIDKKHQKYFEILQHQNITRLGFNQYSDLETIIGKQTRFTHLKKLSARSCDTNILPEIVFELKYLEELTLKGLDCKGHIPKKLELLNNLKSLHLPRMIDTTG